MQGLADWKREQQRKMVEELATRRDELLQSYCERDSALRARERKMMCDDGKYDKSFKMVLARDIVIGPLARAFSNLANAVSRARGLRATAERVVLGCRKSCLALALAGWKRHGRDQQRLRGRRLLHVTILCRAAATHACARLQCMFAGWGWHIDRRRSLSTLATRFMGRRAVVACSACLRSWGELVTAETATDMAASLNDVDSPVAEQSQHIEVNACPPSLACWLACLEASPLGALRYSCER